MTDTQVELLKTLEEYLKMPSLDGHIERQKMRTYLKVLLDLAKIENENETENA